MSHQIVELETNGSHFMTFGDRATYQSYLTNEVAPARAAAKRRGYAYVVAPRGRVQISNGSWLDAGAEVSEDMFAGLVDQRGSVVHPRDVLGRHLRSGLVLSTAALQPAAPDSARFVIAEGRSLTTPRGILDEYSEVTAQDVGGTERLQRLVEVGIVVDRTAPARQPPPEAA